MANEQPTELIAYLAGELDLSSVRQSVRARVAQERALLGAAHQQRATPQTVWRYAWLLHRQALLVPTVIGEEIVHMLCLEYARAMRAIAADAHANPAPHTPYRGALLPLVAASMGLWSALATHMDEAQLAARGWSDRDRHEFSWLNFCMLALRVSCGPDDRARSRRVLSELLAQIQQPERSASTIRLKLLPHAERYFEAADQWATSLAGAGG